MHGRGRLSPLRASTLAICNTSIFIIIEFINSAKTDGSRVINFLIKRIKFLMLPLSRIRVFYY